MNIISLAEAAKSLTQDGLAEKLGCTQGAIHQALMHKRSIYVINDGDSYSAIEVKALYNSGLDVSKIKVSL